MLNVDSYGYITSVHTVADVVSASTISLGGRAISSWTTGTISSSINYAVKWFPSLKLFINCGDYIETSPDGQTWTVRSLVSAQYIAFDDGRKICIAVGGSTYQIYNDGLTWTSGTIENGTSCTSICYSPELGIFCAISNHKYYISSNGTSWTSSSTGIVSYSVQSPVCWSPLLSKFVCIDSTNHKCYNSVNGTTWTSSYYGRPFSTSLLWIPELSIFVSSGMRTDQCRSKCCYK